MLALYFAIGVAYCLVNGGIRKIDTEGDMFLPLMWVLLWPLFFVALSISLIVSLFSGNLEDWEGTEEEEE
jgi:hypothetical protein